jgi:spore maturation protein CgeB
MVLITYKDVNELDEKIKYYLSHEIEREEIAKAGFEHVKNNHSFDVRVKQLMKIIEENI